MLDKFYRAYEVAVNQHGYGDRKGTQVPYIYHPLAVCNTLALWGIPRDEEQDVWCAAILHDTMEDCGTTWSQIAGWIDEPVANLVEELAFRGATKQEKKDYIESFKTKSVEALVIKLADRFCNVRDFRETDFRYHTKYLEAAVGLIEFGKKRNKEIEERFGQTTADAAMYAFSEFEHQ